MGNACHREKVLTLRIGVLCIGNLFSEEDQVLIRYWQSADIRPLVLADGSAYLVERECRRLGIITGTTRASLARIRDIPRDAVSLDDPELRESRVISGPEIRQMGPIALEKYLELEQSVFVELHNEQKYEILELLRRKQYLKIGPPSEWIRVRYEFVKTTSRSDRFGKQK